MARAGGPALALAPATSRARAGAVAVASVRGRPAAALPSAAATATAADTGQLLDGLAGDVRVVGEAQPDAAALAVDLDHAHFHLIALVEHVLDGLDALTRRDVRDVQQPVGALG